MKVRDLGDVEVNCTRPNSSYFWKGCGQAAVSCLTLLSQGFIFMTNQSNLLLVHPKKNLQDESRKRWQHYWLTLREKCLNTSYQETSCFPCYIQIYENALCGPQLHSSVHCSDCCKHWHWTSGALKWTGPRASYVLRFYYQTCSHSFVSLGIVWGSEWAR